MTNELFIPIKFNTSVQLKPSEFGKNIDEIILSKLKGNLENMCSKHGYIKQNSIKIIRRSIGRLIIPQFNGNVHFDMQCVGEICNPAQGSIIKCTVKAKNSLGLLAEGFHNNIPILQIIVPKISAGFQSEIDIDVVNIGEEINIEVCGKTNIYHLLVRLFKTRMKIFKMYLKLEAKLTMIKIQKIMTILP